MRPIDKDKNTKNINPPSKQKKNIVSENYIVKLAEKLREDVTIKKIPNSILKYNVFFDELNYKFIKSQMYHLLTKQVRLVNTSCIVVFNTSASLDELNKISRHITKVITDKILLQMLENFTENYSLFRTKNAITTYVILTLYAIYKRDVILMLLVYYSYSIFIYINMFLKYIRYCDSASFEYAVNISHKNTLFGKFYKNKGHLGIIEYVTQGELIKLIKFINEDKFTKITFTRSFSYLKTRFNQSIKNISKVYYKIMKNSKTNNTNDQNATERSSQKSLIINQIISSHDLLSTPDESKIINLTVKLDIDFATAKTIFQKYVELYKTKLQFKILIYKFVEEIVQSLDDISSLCDSSFFNHISRELSVQNKQSDLKNIVDRIIDFIIKESNISDLVIRNRVKLRLFIFRIEYFMFIYQVFCRS